MDGKFIDNWSFVEIEFIDNINVLITNKWKAGKFPLAIDFFRKSRDIWNAFERLFEQL
jgi:hypothetical protein